MNKAVVVFLKNESMACDVIESGLWVRDTFLPVTPLSTPATRVTISNVPPFIDNDVIKRELAHFGKFASAMIMIPLGCKNPALKHVMSFRRQVFMFLNGPTETLDASFHVTHGDGTYMVFATTENLKCFECGDIGHKRFTCPHKKRNGASSTPNDPVGSGVRAGPTEPEAGEETPPVLGLSNLLLLIDNAELKER